MEVAYSSSDNISHLSVDRLHYDNPNHEMIDRYAESFWSPTAKEEYLKGCGRIINLFKKMQECKIDILIGVKTIEIFFKRYNKSIIPFFSSWDTYKTIEVIFEGSRNSPTIQCKWDVKLYHRTRERFTVDINAGTVLGWGYKTLGPDYSKMPLKDKGLVHQVLDEIEKAYRPNSMHFIMGDD